MKLSFLQLVSMFVLIKLGSAPYAPGKSFFGKKIPILFVQWPWDKPLTPKQIVDCVTPVLTDDKIYQMYQTAWKGRKDNLDLLALGKMILDYDYASYSTKLQRLWNIIWFFDGHPNLKKYHMGFDNTRKKLEEGATAETAFEETRANAFHELAAYIKAQGGIANTPPTKEAKELKRSGTVVSSRKKDTPRQNSKPVATPFPSLFRSKSISHQPSGGSAKAVHKQISVPPNPVAMPAPSPLRSRTISYQPSAPSPYRSRAVSHQATPVYTQNLASVPKPYIPPNPAPFRERRNTYAPPPTRYRQYSIQVYPAEPPNKPVSPPQGRYGTQKPQYNTAPQIYRSTRPY